MKNLKSKIYNLQSSRGFTLIELLLVISIMMIVGAVSVPLYGRFLTQNAVGNTVDQIVMDLRKAQYYAMVSRISGTSGWGVNFSSQTITLYQGSSFVARDQNFDEEFTVNDNISVTGLGDINFARVTGLPNSAATVTVSGQGNSKTITLNAQGMVTR